MISPKPALELLPMDPPQEAAPAAKPPAPDVHAPTVIDIGPMDNQPRTPQAPTEKVEDPFLKEATHQYREGHLDQPLWERALAQAKGDKDAAVDHYLRARATALRLRDRERRSERRAEAVEAVRRELDDAVDQEDGSNPFARPSVFVRYRRALIAAAVVVPLAVGGWLLYAWLIPGTPADATVARTAPAGEPAKARASAAPAPAKTAGAGTAASQPVVGPDLMKKIQELRDAENWNVLVFYLVEWTRREPTNSDAWDQLRADYVKLHQYDDALAAAKKALEFAPGNAQLWRNLGAVNVELGDTTAALRAFEQALARNDNDPESLRQVGMLYLQLGQVQEARIAFERTLAKSPNDAITLCMRSGAAQLSAAPKDSYATAKQVRAIDSQCRGTGESAARRN